MHVCIPSQISFVRGYEEEAKIAYAALLDIEGKTEEAIATLETINNMSSIWHLAQASHMLLHALRTLWAAIWDNSLKKKRMLVKQH